MTKNAGSAMTNSQAVAETFEEELKSINERGKDFKGEKRDFYRSIVQRLENNCQILSDLRDEHSQLRQKLGELVKEKNSRLGTVNLAADIKHMDHEVNLLKKQNDKIKHQKDNSIARQRELEAILANFQKAESTEHPEEQRIKDLKNQLDRANIKNQEATHLVKLYQRIIFHMDNQKMKWNPILQEKQDVIHKKGKDIAELNLIARDSRHSKTIAVNDYYRTEEQCIAARKKRDVVLEAKKEQARAGNVNQMMDIDNEPKSSKHSQQLNPTQSVLRNKMNKAAREKREEKFRAVSSVYEAIRDRFGTTNPEKVKNFFTEREESQKTLEKQIEDLKEACEKLEKEADHIRSALDEAEYASSKGVGGERLITEGKKIYEARRNDLKLVQREVDAMDAHQKSVLSGIAHLHEVMEVIIGQDEAIPENPEQRVDFYIEKISNTKDAMNNEDFDFTTIINVPAFVEQISRTDGGFDIEKVSSEHHIQRRNFEHKRAQKEKPSDYQSRVLDRAQVKMNAIKAVQTYQQQKKEKNH